MLNMFVLFNNMFLGDVAYLLIGSYQVILKNHISDIMKKRM